MDEENALEFAKSVPLSVQQDATEEVLRMSKLPDNYSHSDFEITRKQFSAEEREYLQSVIDKSKELLSDMDVTNFRIVEGLDLSIDTLRFYEFHTDEQFPVAGQSEHGRGAIIVFLQKGIDIKSPEIKRVLAHEISHHTAKSTMMRDRSESGDVPVLELINHGFDTVSRKNGKQNEIIRGLFSESMAELFSYAILSCDGQQLRSPYEHRLPFMVSMIKDYARRTSMDEQEVFRHFYRAYANRDVSLFKELVDQYGTPFVRKLNTIRTVNDFLENPNEVVELARLGNFEEQFHTVQSDFISGKGISLDQIGGSMIYKPVGEV